jgi:hypothetical protein
MCKWLILLSLLSAVACGQTAYTWVDENGQTHYSDRPVPGSSVIELETAQGFSAPQPAAERPSVVPEVDPAAAYSAFNIVQPLHQETLWNVAGNVDVTLEVLPALQTGHRVGVLLDGATVDISTTGSQLQLTDVFRGQHTLQAVILDSDGDEVLRSLAVTFMVQQTSLMNPNNPNVVRPVNPIAR